MNVWCRRLLGALFVAGGMTGLIGVFQNMMAPVSAGPVLLVLVALFALAAFIVGVMMFESNRRAVLPAMVLLLLQIVVLYSPIVTINLMVGAAFWVLIGGDGLTFKFYFGANSDLGLFNGNNWVFGINFVALALFIWLGRVEGDRAPKGEQSDVCIN